MSYSLSESECWGGGVGGYTGGTRKYCSRSTSERKSSCVREVVWVFEPAIVVFGSLAKGVVAAGYRLLEPFAVGLSDRHVVVVGAVVSVVSASQVVWGLANKAAASSAIISLELEVGEPVLEVSQFIGVWRM